MNNMEIDFSQITSNRFEELIYEILVKDGFNNVNWYDGGPDGGKDLTANTIETDASGFKEKLTWYCDAKNYSTGVPFNSIHPTLTRATANNPDYLLLVINPHLSPQCKSEIENWIQNNKPRFRIRYWEKKQITERLLRHPEILREYFPSIWSETLQMSAYFKEAIEVLRAFERRVNVVWKSQEVKPYTELLNIIPKAKDTSIGLFDFTHRITNDESEFLYALLEAAMHMDKLIKTIFNLHIDYNVKIAEWQDKQDAIVVIPEESRLDTESKNAIERLLYDLLNKHSDRLKSGIIAAASAWSPYKAKNKVGIYVVHR